MHFRNCQENTIEIAMVSYRSLIHRYGTRFGPVSKRCAVQGGVAIQCRRIQLLYSVQCCRVGWHGILLTVSGHLDITLSPRSQGQTTTAMVRKVRKGARPSPFKEKLEALKMLEADCLPSAVMYKFGVSSRFVTKLKERRRGSCVLERRFAS